MSPLIYMLSAYNRICFEVSRKVHWSRDGYHEIPVENLPEKLAQQNERLGYLQRKYQLAFEKQHALWVARNNYGYLDLLDKAMEKFDWQPESGKKILDVGSKNFAYASVLHRFFQPVQLEGIEIEGHCIYQDLHSRFDYAQAYISRLENTSYRVMDFCDYCEEVDGITCFYPFVKPETLVYWRLPLLLYKPEDIFRHISRVLKKNGFFFMVNHGLEEGQIALEMMRKLDLRYIGQIEYDTPVFERTNTPVISLWQKTRTRLKDFGLCPRDNYFPCERREGAIS